MGLYGQSMTISVVTICLNGQDYLAQTLESVRIQDCVGVEQIVVDGGSTDGSIEIIRKAAKLSDSFKWLSEPDQGISDAMNKGLAMASGDIVAFLHADDFYPDKEVLRRVTQAFDSNPEAIWLTGGLLMVDKKGQTLQEFQVRNYSFNRLVRSNIIFHPSTFIRSSALRAVGGFRRELRYAMDFDLWLRLGELMSPLLIGRALSCFRVHPGSLSSVEADAAFAEEQQVRLDYLQRTGRTTWPHRLLFQVKRPLNRRSYGRLLSGLRRH